MFAKILHYFNLEHELDDFDTLHKNIEAESIFRGTNLWILMFAILVASVGLNMNSTAVIIGAMLISPLMGPINGMGYSVATYNFELLRKSVKHFTFAVIVSLFTSTTYFAISPVSSPQSELLARTSPSIYDVFIALFGGMAGIIAASSKKKGNVIPGVAIATALMPPLCTAGYGLATFQPKFFFGAIYLFTINTVFIAISSVVVSQILKFPIRTIVNEEQKKKINRVIWVIISITFLPSIYFGYNLVENEKFSQNATKFINSISLLDGSYLLRSNIDASNKRIELTYGGSAVTDEKKEIINKNLKNFELEKAKIEIKQGFSFDEISSSFNEMNKYQAEINKLKALLSEKEKNIDSLLKLNEIGSSIINEISVLFPEITTISYSPNYFFNVDGSKSKKNLFVIKTDNERKTKNDLPNIEKWLKIRTQKDSILVVVLPN